MKPLFSRLDGRTPGRRGARGDLDVRAPHQGPPLSSGVVDPHLARCAECRVRYDAFASWMEEIRSDAQSGRRRAVRARAPRCAAGHRCRRLEAVERPARVIAFPKFAGGSASRSAPVRRWIAAAAAAGFIVGVGLGQMMDLRHNCERLPGHADDAAAAC